MKTRNIVLNSIFLAMLADISVAATPIDLRTQSLNVLQPMTTITNKNGNPNATGIKAIKQSQDFNGTTHIRIRQTYAGYPIWNANAMLHVPKGKQLQSLAQLNPADKAVKMNGTIYHHIERDLANTPSFVFTQANADKALANAMKIYFSGKNKMSIANARVKLMVYIDSNNQAKWAYLIRFAVKNGKQYIAIPHFITDAMTLATYKQWNAIITENTEPTDTPDPVDTQDPADNDDSDSTDTITKLDDVRAGGIGGNINRPLIYDGFRGNLGSIRIQRDAKTKTCYMQNQYATVRHFKTDEVLKFSCEKLDPKHNNVYWNEVFDATMTMGFSPGNDALYNTTEITRLFMYRYKVPFLMNEKVDDHICDLDDADEDDDIFGDMDFETLKNKFKQKKDKLNKAHGFDDDDEDGKPLKLNVLVHWNQNNAAYNPMTRELMLGDGDGVKFYPFTSLTTIAHELAHGFTHQHSNLINDGQSGGLNESFSDMTAQFVESSVMGYNRWLIGSDEMVDGSAFRHMDNPKKDCIKKGRNTPCPIDNMDNYVEGMDGHFTSGIFNKAFYLLSTTKGWTVAKAYDVMIQANMRYWVPTSTFAEAACGVIDATNDYGYEVKDVRNAFAKVGINTNKC